MRKSIMKTSWIVCLAICCTSTGVAQSTSGMGTKLGYTTTSKTTAAKNDTTAQSTSSSSLGGLLNMMGMGNTTTPADTTAAPQSGTNTQGSSSSGLGGLLNMMGVGNTTTPTETTATPQSGTNTQGSSSSSLGGLLNMMGVGNTTTPTETTATPQSGTNTQGSSSSSLGGLLNMMGVGNTTTPTETTTTPQSGTNTQGSSSSGLGGLLNMLGGTAASDSSKSTATGDVITSALGNILGSVVAANQELTVADLAGTWVYVAPACKFKSTDMLKSAGGEVAASQISQKLAPTFTKLGFSSEYNFAFDSEGGFVMTFKKLPLSGSATRAEAKGYFTFEFVKLGTYALATTPVYIEVVGNKMILLFEADKFVEMFKSVVGKLGITTLNSIFDLVDSYDGVLMGFELTKQ